MSTLPSIPMSEFAQRRLTLASALAPNSVAIIKGASHASRNSDVEYPFRQLSDCLYLSGIVEADVTLVIAPGHMHVDTETNVSSPADFIVFSQPKNPQLEIWTGRIIGQEAMKTSYGADQAFDHTLLSSMLPDILADKTAIYYHVGENEKFDQTILKALHAVKAKARQGVNAPERLENISPLLSDMRLFKSHNELEMMRKASDISALAHCNAMLASPTSQHEFELEAQLLHTFVKQGARHQAYSSIVGSGENACVLHYTDNDQPIHEDDLILIDAGCELQGYAADITRTFPARGIFSPAQKALYNIVLAAQEAAIATIKIGNHWNSPHEAALEVLTQGLIDLGILTGELSTLIADKAYFPYYMHRTGHWLGLDVHDVGSYKVDGQWRMFEPGMVLTVEPGLYIAPDAEVDACYRGIGIRIEDDVVVTQGDAEILTKGVPKTVTEIEALMATHSR